MSKKYTAEYIYKYVKGELSKEENYQLEKSALSDPFLSDMMSGYEVAYKKFGNQKVKEYLDNIAVTTLINPKSRFKNKKNILIGSGIILSLIILSAISWNQLNDKTEASEIAENEVPVQQDGKSLVNANLLESFSLDIFIFDEQNVPIKNKSVAIYNQTYITDENGKIAITPLKAGTNLNIEINGFNPQQISIPKGHHEPVMIQLTTKDAKKSTDNTNKEKLYPPEGGWYKFQNFVATNKQLPITNPFVKGTVLIKASLSSNNVLSGFEVVQSLNALYDAEAIRLIQAYDSWKNKMSAPIVVYLEVNF